MQVCFNQISSSDVKSIMNDLFMDTNNGMIKVERIDFDDEGDMCYIQLFGYSKLVTTFVSSIKLYTKVNVDNTYNYR